MPDASALKLIVIQSCVDGWNEVTCNLSASSLIDSGGEPVYYSHFLNVNGTLLVGPYTQNPAHTFKYVDNGIYEIWGEDSLGRRSPTVERTGSCVVTPPPPVCDLQFTQAPPANVAAGSNVTVTLTSSAPGIQIRFTPQGSAGTDWRNGVTSGQPYTINTLPVGGYTVQARDAKGCLTAIYPLTISAPVRGGCTDPSALNYDPEATQDNGTCEYAPVEKGVFFEIPMMNSLRFVQGVQPDNITVFSNQDNTLLCEQKLRNVFNKQYEQKVNKADVLTIQFLSTLSGHEAGIYSKENELLATASIRKALTLTGQSLLYNTFIKAHGPNQTKVYFDATVFNYNIPAGQVIELRNAGEYNGRYLTQGINQDSPATQQYFIINRAFTGPGQVAGVTVYAEYDIQPFDVYEATFNFAGVPDGIVHAKITGTGGGNTFLAISEPISVEVEHPGTYLIKYRNIDPWNDLVYSTGLVHQLRVEANLWHPNPGGERSLHRNSNGSITKLYAQKTRVFEFATYLLPPYLHEKLSVVFDYDNVYINGLEYQTEEAYEPEYSNRLNLANGSVLIEQVRWMANTNNSHDNGTSINVDAPATGGRIIANGGFLKY